MEEAGDSALPVGGNDTENDNSQAAMPIISNNDLLCSEDADSDTIQELRMQSLCSLHGRLEGGASLGFFKVADGVNHAGETRYEMFAVTGKEDSIFKRIKKLLDQIDQNTKDGLDNSEHLVELAAMMLATEVRVEWLDATVAQYVVMLIVAAV